MGKRVQSPSSINTFLQCPRKYYYSYIEKLPRLLSIHTTRGHIAHSVLEDFFDIDPTLIPAKGDYELILKQRIQQLLVTHWTKGKTELETIGLSSDQQKFYFEETMMMLFNWLHHFVQRLRALPLTVAEGFLALTPTREELYTSERLSVQGFIDAVERLEGQVRLMDYKTSKSSEIRDEYRLQLAIYALLYYERHGKYPDKVGLYFLKDHQNHEVTLDVDEELISLAKREIMFVHENTISDDIKDYSKKPGPLCKWSSGQCDFYDPCMVQKGINDFVPVNQLKKNV